MTTTNRPFLALALAISRQWSCEKACRFAGVKTNNVKSSKKPKP